MPNCVATNKRGQRCGQHALTGATVCRLHGGAAPQVIAKARERILLAANDAASLVHQMILGKVSNGKVGRGHKMEEVEHSVRLRAAVAALGMAAGIVFAPEPPKDNGQEVDYSRLTDEELEFLRGISEKLTKPAKQLAASAEVIEVKAEASTEAAVTPAEATPEPQKD